MDAVKAILMGCGALAIFSFVGCVGLVGVGTYAVDQSLRDEGGNHALLDRDYADSGSENGRSYRPGSRRPDKASYGEDPFGDYQSEPSGSQSGAAAK